MVTPEIITNRGVLQRGNELEIRFLMAHPANSTFTVLLEEEHILEAFAGRYEATEWEELGKFFGAALMRLMALTPPTPDGDENYRQSETRKAFKEHGFPKVISGIEEVLRIQ